jgi:glycosyltransferase involved in cell wall biosynthesis
MAFGVPTVARAHAAIPETMGDAGVLLPKEEDPVLMAEAVAEILQQPSLQRALVERGRRRLDVFDADRARASVLEHLLSIA